MDGKTMTTEAKVEGMPTDEKRKEQILRELLDEYGVPHQPSMRELALADGIVDARLALSAAESEIASLIETRKRENENAEKLIASTPGMERLREATDLLQELLDLQNGPPLFKYEEAWIDCTERAYAFLARPADDKTKEG
jgi:hypothetical protein